MGWLQMSKQELRRVEVLTEVLAGQRTTESAAGVLDVSLRQAQRLVARYRDGGGGALIHESRGRPASNKLSTGTRELVLELVRQSYRDFGPTLAAEALLERQGITVSRETLRNTQATKKLPSTKTPTRELRRADPDRRQRTSLVRGSRRGLHAAGLHRRRD